MRCDGVWIVRVIQGKLEETREPKKKSQNEKAKERQYCMTEVATYF